MTERALTTTHGGQVAALGRCGEIGGGLHVRGDVVHCP